MPAEVHQLSLWELGRLLGGTLSSPAHADITIARGNVNSRACAPGHAFIAVRGQKSDGHEFIEDAFSHGACAAIVENGQVLRGKPGLIVSNSRRSVSQLAALFSGYPSRHLKVVGITGTNGKTTINWLVYHLLNSLGWPSLRIGTLGVASERGLDRPGNLTTPDPFEMQADLAWAVEHGVKGCVMEVSSHALDQHRADDVYFDVAVFTNLTRDHLDYHQSMEAYFAAKRRLFTLTAEGPKTTRAAVVNSDSEQGELLRRELNGWGLKDFCFGYGDKSSVRIVEFEDHIGGSRLGLAFGGKDYQVKSGFMGRHNAENLAAAFACGVALGFEPSRVADELGRAPQVPGRMEAVGTSELAAFVDYSHTPDALERALKCLKPLIKGKLWVVFGCGGDRDRGKRPQMADVAWRLGDRVVVTSDNPRTEDPNSIIDEILSGDSGPEIKRTGIIEADRRLAIKRTVLEASAGDAILVAGKGHEDYQIIGTVKHPFSDQAEIRTALAARGKRE